MKILLIRSLNPYFQSSASANRYAGIIDGLIKQGVKVTLVITGGYNHLKEYRVKGKYKNLENLKVAYIIPTFNHNIWFRRINLYIFSRLNKLLLNVRLRQYFKSDFDFVWVTIEGNILNSFYKNHACIKGKTIIELNEFNDLHNYDNEISSIHRIMAEKENQIFLKAIKKIDLLVVMTKTLITHYKHIAAPDVKVLHFPMTVDLERFSNIETQDANLSKPYIAYTGTFTNQKDGVHILIQSFAQIAPKYPQYKLYLAGFYHYDLAMQKKLIEKFKLKDRIIYLGELQKDKIIAFVQNAELLVMARPESRQAKGGFPTKLGEYLASGNPVCVTDVGEISDYLEDNESAFIAKPGDIESFAEAMNRALSDRNNAKEVGIRGRKIAEKHFNIDVQSERLINFFKDNHRK